MKPFFDKISIDQSWATLGFAALALTACGTQARAPKPTASVSVIQTGTSSTSAPPPAISERPILTTSTLSQTFSAATGNTARSFVIQNSGDFVAYGVTVLVQAGSEFQILQNTCSVSQLIVGQSCEIRVGFYNSTPYAKSAVFTVNYKNRSGEAAGMLMMTVGGPGATPTPGSTTTPTSTPTSNPTSTPTSTSGSSTWRVISSQSFVTKSSVKCTGSTMFGSPSYWDNHKYVCNYSTPSTFDGANCLIGQPPTGRTGFIKGDYIYYSTVGGNQPCVSGHYYDSNVNGCFWGRAYGNSPFVYANKYYFKPSIVQITKYSQGECPVGTSYDGANCFVGTTPRKAWVWSATNYSPKFWYYSPVSTHASPCDSGHYYDGANCIAAQAPSGWTPFVYNDTLIYLTPISRTCVE